MFSIPISNTLLNQIFANKGIEERIGFKNLRFFFFFFY